SSLTITSRASSRMPKRSTPTKARIRCKTWSSARPLPASALLYDTGVIRLPTGDVNMAPATLVPPVAVPPASSLTAPLGLTNVLYEKKGAIAYVTINRPKVLNALNTPTWKDLRTAFEDARDDVAVRGVVLTGAGDKAFIAGADISELAHVAAFEAEQSSRF